MTTKLEGMAIPGKLKWYVILALALCLAFSGVAAAEQLYVNESGWWRDGGTFNASAAPISAAVGAAGEEDAIYVYGGNYNEGGGVSITKERITLQGEDANTTTIHGSYTAEKVVQVTGDYVNVSGFTVAGIASYSYGIYVNADYCTISDNDASEMRYGIYLSSSSNNNITSNTANSNNGCGIYLSYSSNNNLTNNIANSNDGTGICLSYSSNNNLTNNIANSNDGMGISLSSASNNALTRNTANSNNYGIYLSSSSNNALTNNTFVNNGLVVFYSFQNTVKDTTVNGKPLVYRENVSGQTITDAGQVILVNCDNITVKNLDLSNASIGVELWGTTDSKIMDDTASNNYYGIYLYSSSNNTLTSNTANSNNYGIYLSYSSNNTLTSNTANSNNYGIYLSYGICLPYSSNNNTLTSNIANSNSQHGIYLSHSSNNNLTNNTASNSNIGIYLSSSSNNVLTSNTANENNNYGIHLYYSSNNNITSNIANSNDCGIYLRPSSNNNITSNIANSNSQHGIYLYYSSNNNITSNIANSNNYGIHLDSSSNNNITSNIANSNSQHGIHLDFFSYYGSPSSNNLIYNNYLNNTHNAYDNGNNQWNITKTNGTNIINGSYLGGNYWSDYIDVDGDGLGGLPYSIHGGINKDYLPLTTTPKTIYVDDDFSDDPLNHTWDTIQEGLNDANNGDVIYVYNGTYYGTIDITKSIMLRGEDADATVIHGEWLVTTVVHITAANVTVSGFTVTGTVENGAYGIYVSSNYCNISDNIISDGDYGIYLTNSDYSVISRNDASHRIYGIYLSLCGNCSLEDNIVNSNSEYGICLYSSSNNNITNNTINSNDDYGIYLYSSYGYSSSNNLIYNNYFNNTHNAYDNGNNQWNITKTNGTNIINGSYLGGNYWSDYIDVTDGDGLGNSPYSILGGVNKDYLPLTTTPKTIYVDDDFSDDPLNHTWDTIQEGVNDANHGDTIVTYNGTYYGAVNIRKSVMLRGEDATNTIIHGEWAVDKVINVAIHGVTVSGFEVTGATCEGGYGIYVIGDNCNISDNLVTDGRYGIYLSDSDNSTVFRNNASGHCANGIRLEYSNGCVISDNLANSNCNENIYLYRSSNCTLINNSANNSRYDEGIYLGSSINCTLINNIANLNDYRGIYLTSSGNCTLKNNIANSNRYYDGIRLSSSDNCNLGNNIANSNDDDGICLSSSCNCDITDNIIDSNNCGIRILAGSMYNKITNNNVSNNKEWGIHLHCSGNNEIYHNNIIENNKQAYDYKGFNDWDKEAIIGGNYWSDYNCTGNPSNGTEPYTKIDTDAGAVDNYPFEDPGGWIIPQRGDLNGDGILTPADAVIALKLAVSGEWDEDADVSDNGRVSSLDALMILQAAAGSIEVGYA